MNEDLSKLNLIELLDLLKPIPEPPAMSLWPQTAGWLWLGVAWLVCAGWLTYRWWRNRRANAYRRSALKEIATAGQDATRLAEIVRRTALAAFPRAEVAGLYGEGWLAFLDKTYGGTGFCDGPGRVLATAPYTSGVEAADLASLAAEWVQRHRREAA